jgi:predicted ATPase
VIDLLSVANFKAFSAADIPLGRYTLLSGLNSSGKSTVLQAIALMRQAIDSHDGDPAELDGAPLNGELVDLGTGQDVLYEDYARRRGSGPEIEFLLTGKKSGAFGFSLSYEPGADYLRVVRPRWEPTTDAPAREAFPLFKPGFQYLRADRITPAVAYPRSERMSIRRRFLGTRGEYAIDFLRGHQDEPVPQGQSAMARLTCAAAASGAQVIVETHSDHILNGVRLAVKRQVLRAADVELHYFQREDGGIQILTPELGPDGMLSHWPPGFFDEWGRLLDELLRPGPPCR